MHLKGIDSAYDNDDNLNPASAETENHPGFDGVEFRDFRRRAGG